MIELRNIRSLSRSRIILMPFTSESVTSKDESGAHLAEGSRFAFLDGMRGIAALFILTRHTHAYWTFSFHRSYLAVDLFFILSGFVIAHAYDSKISTKRISVAGFTLSRIIRLYPIYFLSVIIAAAAMLSQATFFGVRPAASISNIALMILFTFAFLPSHFLPADSHMFPLNYPYWSLFFELVANAIYVTIHRYLSAAVLSIIIALSLAYTFRSAIKHGNLDTGYIFTRGMFEDDAGIFHRGRFISFPRDLLEIFYWQDLAMARRAHRGSRALFELDASSRSDSGFIRGLRVVSDSGADCHQ